MNAPRRLSVREWRKTPYATTKAGDTQADVRKLLARYGVKQYQWTEGYGPNGRLGILLRFVLKGQPYKVQLETLVVDATVPEEKLMAQIARALYYQLKTSLELATVFFPLEQTMYAWRELSDSSTVWEATSPHLESLTREALQDPSRLLPHRPAEEEKHHGDHPGG